MGKCALFELHVRMQVNLGCLRRFMAEPKSNHGQVNAASKQRMGAPTRSSTSWQRSEVSSLLRRPV
jgi:hypothetical protein